MRFYSSALFEDLGGPDRGIHTVEKIHWGPGCLKMREVRFNKPIDISVILNKSHVQR